MGKRNSVLGRKMLVSMLFVVGSFALCMGIWQKEHARSYSLTLTDESGRRDETEHEQAEAGENISENNAKNIIPWELENTNIRVVIYDSGYSSIYHQELKIAGNTCEILINAEQLQNSYDALCILCAENGYLLERAENGFYLKNEQTEKIAQTSVERSMGTPVYRGSFYIYPEERGLVLVNELPFEQYLYGVLPSEMPASYEQEALKAQAVCARTFACRYLDEPKYPQYHAQLDDSTSCQVYMNLAEQAATSQAVDETKGILLTYQGAPATTFYYSTSCGLSADVTTWPDYAKADYPYLSAYTLDNAHEVMDFSDDVKGERLLAYLSGESECYEKALPWFRWNCCIERADVQLIYERMVERYAIKPEMIQKYKEGALVLEAPERLSFVTGVEVTARNAGGSVAAILLTGPECSYLIYGEYNIRYILCGAETQVTKQDGTVQTMSTILPSGFFVLEPILYNDGNIGYSIVGGGYGHGVGLSQNGANEMAKQGMNYQEILAYYYVGTQLMQIAGE